MKNIHTKINAQQEKSDQPITHRVIKNLLQYKKTLLKKIWDFHFKIAKLTTWKQSKTENPLISPEELKNDINIMTLEELEKSLTITIPEIRENTNQYIKLNPELNQRPIINHKNTANRPFWHWTNWYSLWNCLTKTNAQIVAHNIRDELNILTLTGESAWTRQLNQDYVSVVALDTMSSKFHDLKDYADRSSSFSRFAITPANIHLVVNKYQEQLLITKEQLKESKQTWSNELLNKMNSEFIKHLINRIKKLKNIETFFKSISIRQQNLITELSRIPIIIIWDRSYTIKNDNDNVQHVDSSISNEVWVSRLNTRVIATSKENIKKVKILLIKSWKSDIKVIDFKQLDQYSHGNIDNIY